MADAFALWIAQLQGHVNAAKRSPNAYAIVTAECDALLALLAHPVPPLDRRGAVGDRRSYHLADGTQAVIQGRRKQTRRRKDPSHTLAYLTGLVVTDLPTTIDVSDTTTYIVGYALTWDPGTQQAQGTATVTFASSNAAVFTVNSSTGVVTPVGSGQAFVTVSAAVTGQPTLTRSTSATQITVTVTPPTPASLFLDRNQVDTQVSGPDVVVTVTVKTANGTVIPEQAPNVTWASGNASFATATAGPSATTTVHPVAAGTTSLTATLGSLTAVIPSVVAPAAAPGTGIWLYQNDASRLTSANGGYNQSNTNLLSNVNGNTGSSYIFGDMSPTAGANLDAVIPIELVPTMVQNFTQNGNSLNSEWPVNSGLRDNRLVKTVTESRTHAIGTIAIRGAFETTWYLQVTNDEENRQGIKFKTAQQKVFQVLDYVFPIGTSLSNQTKKTMRMRRAQDEGDLLTLDYTSGSVAIVYPGGTSANYNGLHWFIQNTAMNGSFAPGSPYGSLTWAPNHNFAPYHAPIVDGFYHRLEYWFDHTDPLVVKFGLIHDGVTVMDIAFTQPLGTPTDTLHQNCKYVWFQSLFNGGAGGDIPNRTDHWTNCMANTGPIGLVNI